MGGVFQCLDKLPIFRTQWIKKGSPNASEMEYIFWLISRSYWKTRCTSKQSAFLPMLFPASSLSVSLCECLRFPVCLCAAYPFLLSPTSVCVYTRGHL